MFHILSGLVIIELLFYSMSRSWLDIPFIGVQNPALEDKIQIWLMIIGVLILLKGILPWCLMKHKTLRIAQVIIGILLIMIGGPIMDPIVTNIPAPAPKDDKAVNIDVGPTIKKSSHPGVFFVLLWVMFLFLGVTGKWTTEKCLRYKEVVKKIRV